MDKNKKNDNGESSKTQTNKPATNNDAVSGNLSKPARTDLNEETGEKPELNEIRSILNKSYNVLKPVKSSRKHLKSEFDSNFSSSSKSVEEGDIDSSESLSNSDDEADLSWLVKVRNKTKADSEKVRKFHLLNSFTRLFPGLRKEFQAEAQKQQKELILKNKTSLVRRPTIDEIGKAWGIDVDKFKPYFKNFTINEADRKIHYNFFNVVGVNMGRLLQTGRYSDIEIHCEFFVFNVHSFVLSGQSDVFRRRLFFNSHARPIVVVDLKPIELAGFLHFLYTGVIIEPFQDPKVDGKPSKHFASILKNYEVPYWGLLKN